MAQFLAEYFPVTNTPADLEIGDVKVMDRDQTDMGSDLNIDIPCDFR